MHRDPPHYLKPLRTTSTPKRLGFMDVQTRSVAKGKNREHVWSCGAMGTRHWTVKTNTRKDDLKVFEHPVDMWRKLDLFCKPSKRVTVWTFDLPHQLRVSQALVHLPRLGWHLETVVLEPGAAWALFRDGKRSLMFCDLKAWTPYDWERVKNAAMGNDRLDNLPRVGNNPAASMAFNRCQVIRKAVTQILEWIERDNLGTFRPTGSGQSYSAFRRNWLQDRILVHDDIPRLVAERVAMWSGRTEAWRHGNIHGGPFIELDMKAAYTRIASQCNVPTVAMGQVYRPTVKQLLTRTDRYAYLCECKVETEIPIVPASSGAHTFWPVGEFTTWLWDPELILLDKYAGRVQIRRAYKYRTAPALAEFSGYVLDTLDAPPDITTGLPALVLKHWSRTLVGRFGLRYRSWVPFSHDNDPDLSMVTFLDADNSYMTDMLCVGKDMLLLGDLTESLESVPQIPGWIMSECRRRLWETMLDIGLDRVVYVDTDSIIVDTKGDLTYPRLLAKRYGSMWAFKAQHSRMHIYGPRNLHTETDRRISGLPLGAIQAGPTEYRGEVMQSIKEAMRHGQLDTVTSIPRRFMFTAPDIRRGHNPDGTTYPFRLEYKQPQEV